MCEEDGGASRRQQLPTLFLWLGLDQPDDAERLEAGRLPINHALPHAGLLSTLSRQLPERDDRANQLIGVLLGPDHGQAHLRPVVGGLALGPLAGCYAR
jgi:hypothetical protein